MQTDRTGSPFQHCFLFFSFSGNAGLFSLRLRIYANLPFFFIARANVRALETRKSERGAVAGKKNNEKRKKKHRDDCEGRGKLRHPRSLSATSFLIFVFLTSSLPLFAFLSGLTDASTLPTDRWKKKRKKKRPSPNSRQRKVTTCNARVTSVLFFTLLTSRIADCSIALGRTTIRPLARYNSRSILAKNTGCQRPGPNG